MSEAAGSASPGATRAPLVVEERAGSVAIVRMNRPERLNALNVELAQALLAALLRAAGDEEVRCVLLGGAGKAFCAGGDLALLRDARERNAGHELEGLLRAGGDIAKALVTMAKPCIAAVQGPAAGAGMNLALACDIRIAGEEASFGQNFARVGLFPDFGGTYFLPRLVGPAKAAELFYTGEMIGAAEALRLGIVNRVVATAQLEAEAKALAGRIAAGPPLAARVVKRVLFADEQKALEEALEHEGRQQAACFRSADAAEGFTAFFEKREPRFKGR